LEDPHRVAIVPVVQDESEDVEVAAPWNAAEEIARDHATSRREARSGQASSRGGRNYGQVEHNPRHSGVRLEKGLHQRSGATTDVHDSPGARTIQDAKNRSAELAPMVRHDFGEQPQAAR